MIQVPKKNISSKLEDIKWPDNSREVPEAPKNEPRASPPSVAGATFGGRSPLQKVAKETFAEARKSEGELRQSSGGQRPPNREGEPPLPLRRSSDSFVRAVLAALVVLTLIVAGVAVFNLTKKQLTRTRSRDNAALVENINLVEEVRKLFRESFKTYRSLQEGPSGF